MNSEIFLALHLILKGQTLECHVLLGSFSQILELQAALVESEELLLKFQLALLEPQALLLAS